MRDKKRLAELFSRALIAVVCGWAVLLAIAYGVERPLVRWSGFWFGPMWIATAHLAFDCLTLAAAGWVCGRANRAHAVVSGVLFAVSLCFWDFGGVVALNVPWLMQLMGSTIQDGRFFDSLLTSLGTHAVLFGCLIGGAMLSRPREKVASIFSVR